MFERPPATVSPQIRGVLNKKPLAPHRWGYTNDQYTKCITLMGGVLTFLLILLLGGLLQCNSITFCILYTVHYCALYTTVHFLQSRCKSHSRKCPVGKSGKSELS